VVGRAVAILYKLSWKNNDHKKRKVEMFIPFAFSIIGQYCIA
jgi:hypothetical protein